jgi:tetratricopeptide (TPR) repeat protein
LELDPLNPLFLVLSGTMLKSLGRFDEAISVYLDALRTSPDLPIAHGGLVAYYEKGMHEEALELAERRYARRTGQEITGLFKVHTLREVLKRHGYFSRKRWQPGPRHPIAPTSKSRKYSIGQDKRIGPLLA